MAQAITPEYLARGDSEFAHQAGLICWTEQPETRETFPDARKIFAIKNAEKSSGTTAAIRGGRNKMEGVKPGVADLFLPVARRGAHGLFVEMKKPSEKPKRPGSKGGMRDDQLAFRDQVTQDGFYHCVCYSWEEARECIIWYLTN